jgi:hypothetical protein
MARLMFVSTLLKRIQMKKTKNALNEKKSLSLEVVRLRTARFGLRAGRVMVADCTQVTNTCDKPTMI